MNKSSSHELEAFNRAVGQHRVKFRQLMFDRSALTGCDIHYAYTIENISERILRIEYPSTTAILFYAYDNEQHRLDMWLLDAAGITSAAHIIVTESALARAIADLRGALNVKALQLTRAPRKRDLMLETEEISRSGSLQDTIRHLSHMVLPEPIPTALEDVQHLIIVPVLGLGAIPYSLLEPFSEDNKEVSFSIAPSLYDLGRLRLLDRSSKFEAPLVIGDPDLSADSEWHFPPLPGAAEEARSVARLLNTDPLVGERATKAALLQRLDIRLVDASGHLPDLLYFATHGVADGEDPLSGSFLALGTSTEINGRWTAQEIQQTFLTARLAVLSACQTGLGKVHDAGIIGLARAFLIAGVENVVMSLWSVQDEATSELMQAFMHHLPNHPPAQALRLAMLRIREKRSNPAEWASFVVFGT